MPSHVRIPLSRKIKKWLAAKLPTIILVGLGMFFVGYVIFRNILGA